MKRSLYLLCFDTLSTLGSGIFTFTCSFYILQQTESGSIFGLYLALLTIVNTLTTPFIGNLIGRHHNKTMLFIGQIVSIVALSCFALFYNGQYVFIFLLMMILVVVDVIVKTIVTSNLKWITGNYLERVISIRQLIQSSSMLASPIIGGILISFLSIQHVSLINIMTEGIALIFIFLLTFKNGQTTQKRKSFWGDFKAGVQYLYQMTEVKYLLVIAVFMNFIMNVLIVGIPILIVQQLSLSAKHLGVAEGTLGVSLIVSALIFSVIPLKNQLRRSYLYALMLQLLILILYLVVISLGLSSTIVYGTVLIGQLLLGLSITLGNIPYQILLQHTVDEAYKSRVFSVNQSFVSALVPLSYMLFGFLLPLSFTFTLVGCAVSMGFIVIIFLKKIYRNA